MTKLPLIALLALPLIGCGTSPDSAEHKLDLANVDLRAELMLSNASNQTLEHVLTIDHSRLADKEGEYLEASRVDFYANDKLNTELMQENVLAGLDLPMRVLSYSEDSQIKTMYTDAEFLAKRHGLSNREALKQYDDQVHTLVERIPSAEAVASDPVDKDYGIKKIVSQYDFEETLEKIEHDVLAEGDTVWFMNWDYQQRAVELGEELPKATLLVFGGPAPGAKAMTDFSSIGLDAFGQKVLVFEQEGEVVVAYNDIVDFAELHYDDNAIAHRVINYRLGSTLKGAVIEQ